MNNDYGIAEVKIEYENNAEATNKLISFIIDYLLENNCALGENHEREDIRRGYKDE